jgi:hypothetical protein
MVTPYATETRRLLLKLRPKCVVLQPDTAPPLVTSKKHDVGRLDATYFGTDPNRCPTLIRNRASGGTRRDGWRNPAAERGGPTPYRAALGLPGPVADRKQKDWREKAGDWQEKSEA